MATAPKKGKPDIGPLYIRMTTPSPDGSLPGARDIFGKLSVTSQFKVSLHLTNYDRDLMGWLSTCGLTNNVRTANTFDFFCSETALPGATFDMAEESGSRQGIIERFPTRRIYPDFTMTFYVDYDYKIIRLFEEWMNYINPIYSSSGIVPPDATGQGNAKNSQDFFRFKYPNTYKRIISVTKFERDFLENPNEPGGPTITQPTITYRMIDSFPTNITALPLSYEGSTITKTTVSFSYARYLIEKNNGSRK